MNGKFCWIAKEYKKGWRLGLDINGKTRYIPGVVFKDELEVRYILAGNIVFVHMRGDK